MPQMESQQDRFTHTMDLLELEVAGLEQHEDVAIVDRIAKLVGEIAGKIADAEEKCERYKCSNPWIDRYLVQFLEYTDHVKPAVITR